MAGMLLTDWVTIGTSGPTIDGREISAEDLKVMAETYDPAVYTAVINVEHFYGNLGTVRQLRTAPGVQGKTALQARIRPNLFFLSQNAEDRRLFSSMEITRNFMKSGKPYLTGVGTTDTPASIGTTEIHFSKQDDCRAERAAALELSMEAFKNCREENGMFQDFFNRLGEMFAAGKNTKDQTDMTADEVKGVVAGEMAPVLEKLGSLAETLEKFAADGENADKGKEQEQPADKGKEQEQPADIKAEFAAALKPLTEKLDALAEQFSAILAEKPGTHFAAGKGAANSETPKFI